MTDQRRNLPSASSWRRLELCAGSWQLEQQAKAIGQEAHKTSPAAARGSLIHAWLAGLPDEDGKEIKLMAAEQRTADFLQERAQEQVSRIFGDAQVETLIEKRLWMKVNGRPALSGQFDKVVYSGTTALILDFKSGHSEPDPAEQNAQLKVLAVLVALHLPQAITVIAQIISGPHGVTEARYSIAELAHAYNEILDTLRAIHAESAPFNPSPEACKWCPASLICQAVKDSILPVARQQYSALPLEPDRAAKLLDEVAVIKSHIAEIEKFYFQRLSEDLAFSIPGYALVPGITRREVTNWHVARKRLEEFIDEKELQAAETYQLGDIEKALGRKLKLKTREAKIKLNEILQGLIKENQNSPSLRRVRGEPKIAELTA
jgi:Protein of unknown function (DUF2800)